MLLNMSQLNIRRIRYFTTVGVLAGAVLVVLLLTLSQAQPVRAQETIIIPSPNSPQSLIEWAVEGEINGSLFVLSGTLPLNMALPEASITVAMTTTPVYTTSCSPVGGGLCDGVSLITWNFEGIAAGIPIAGSGEFSVTRYVSGLLEIVVNLSPIQEVGGGDPGTIVVPIATAAGESLIGLAVEGMLGNMPVDLAESFPISAMVPPSQINASVEISTSDIETFVSFDVEAFMDLAAPALYLGGSGTITVGVPTSMTGFIEATVGITPELLAVNDAFTMTELLFCGGADRNDVYVGNVWYTFERPDHTETFSSMPWGHFCLIAEEGFSGEILFDYSLHQGSRIATATVTVNVIGDELVANDDIYTVEEDESLTVSASEGVLSNDQGQNLVVIGSVLPQARGFFQMDDDGSFYYIPRPDFFGTVVGWYVVSDGVVSDTADFTIVVEAVNDAPEANDDEVITNQDVAVKVEALYNDTDAEGDTLTIFAIGQPGYGVVISETGDLRDYMIYTPTIGFHGTDFFTYTISDGILTDTAMVWVEVVQTEWQVYLPAFPR